MTTFVTLPDGTVVEATVATLEDKQLTVARKRDEALAIRAEATGYRQLADERDAVALALEQEADKLEGV